MHFLLKEASRDYKHPSGTTVSVGDQKCSAITLDNALFVYAMILYCIPLIYMGEVCQYFLYRGKSWINFPSNTLSSPPSDCGIILRSGTTPPRMAYDMGSRCW